MPRGVIMGRSLSIGLHSGPRWGLILALAVAALLAAWFIEQNALRYASYTQAAYGDYFWPRRAGLIPHIAGGLVALLTGLVQIWLGVTGRTGRLHRTLGKAYVGAIIIASCGGFYLATTIPAKYLAYAAGLFALCVAWVVTTSMAIIAIRRRAIDQHREWMLRSYVVTFAFVTFRLVSNLLVGWHVAPADDVDTIMAWACWSVPLLVAEPLLQQRRLRRR